MEKQELLNFVRGKLILADIRSKDVLILAISGGSDSMALLDVLNKLYQELELKIIPVHINHGLRSDAKKDEKVVVDYCKAKELNCVVKRVAVKKMLGAQGGGVEEKARELRYQALTQVATQKQAKYILTAHNSDDQVETIVFNFLRGSTTRGLGGMKEISGMISRPLLDIPKADLLKYIKKNKIVFAHDKTNDDIQFTRNRIRHQLLPELRKFNPNLHEVLLRNSSVFQQTDLVLRGLAGHYLNLMSETSSLTGKNKIVISISQLKELLPVMQIEVIKGAYRKVLPTTKDLKGVHFEEVMKLLESSKAKAVKRLPGKLLVGRAYDKITISRIT